MQVKIFNIFLIEGNPETGENKINGWLRSKPNIEIKFIKQSQSESLGVDSLIISVWYK